VSNQAKALEAPHKPSANLRITARRIACKWVKYEIEKGIEDKKDLLGIDIAKYPFFAWLHRLDNRVLGCLKVPTGMFVHR
jgi:hypothetical protein